MAARDTLNDYIQNKSLDLVVLRRAFHGAVEPLTPLGSIAARDTLKDQVENRSLDQVELES